MFIYLLKVIPERRSVHEIRCPRYYCINYFLDPILFILENIICISPSVIDLLKHFIFLIVCSLKNNDYLNINQFR